MPIGIIAAIGGYLAGGLVGGGIAGLIVGGLVTVGLSYVLRSAFSSDSDYDSQRDTGRELTTRIEPNAPWEIVYGRTRKAGKITYIESTGVNGFMNMVITLAAHEVDAIENVWLDDEVLTIDQYGNVSTGKYAGAIHIQFNLGKTDQTAFSSLVATSAGKWTSAHRQQGHAGIYILLSWAEKFFPNGIPNITVVMRGKKVYDPRTGLTVYSNNAALCMADYLTTPATLGGYGDSLENLDTDFLIAAANICDENVPLKGGGTEKRYTCNGIISTGDTPSFILGRMLTSMAGIAPLVGGKWRIMPAVYRAPSFSLNESDMRGPMKTSTKVSRRDLFNGVKGTFADPDNRWQPSDFPPAESTSYMEEDGGQRIWKDIELPFTTSSKTAQRIGRLIMDRSRRQIEVVARCNMAAYLLTIGDVVNFSFARYGWSNKPFEVTNLVMVINENELGVDVVLRETDANAFAWDETRDEKDLLPNATTTLPDAFNVGAPGVPSFIEELYQTSGSAGVKTKLNVHWAPPEDQFVEQGGQYQLEYKQHSLDNYSVLTNIRVNEFTITDIQSELYDFRVKSINVFGAPSSYTSALYQVMGLSALPSDVRSFSVRPSNGFAHMTWALHDDLDVKIGGVMEVRHTVAASANITWSDSALIDRFNGGAVVGIGPLIEGHYLARAQDSSLNYSLNFARFLVDEALISGYVTVNSVVEAPTFSGSKVSLSVSAGVLELTDPMSSLVGTYYFPGTPAPFYADCGSSTTRRFESDLVMTRFDVGDLMDNRPLIDLWPSVDGGIVDRGDARLYVQTTKDDPSSGAAWSEWTEFRVAEFLARAARFKLEFESDSGIHNIGVTALNVHIKRPA